MSGLMHKVKDAIQGGHKDGMCSPSLLHLNRHIHFHMLTLDSQRQQSWSIKGSRENTAANLAFTILPSQDQSLMVTPYPLQTPASSTPPSVASTVTVTPAHLAPASPTNHSLARLEPRVSPALLPMAAPSLPPIQASFIRPSLAFMVREMPELGEQGFPTPS